MNRGSFFGVVYFSFTSTLYNHNKKKNPDKNILTVRKECFIFSPRTQVNHKGHRALAEGGLGEKYTLSPIALISSAIESKFGIYTASSHLRLKLVC